MDQDLLGDEQLSSSRRVEASCQGHILKVDVGAVEPFCGSTPIQTKETVIPKKMSEGRIKNYIKLSP